MRKKILVASLVSLGVLGLAACSGDEGQDTEEVTLTTITAEPVAAEPMQAAQPAAAEPMQAEQPAAETTATPDQMDQAAPQTESPNATTPATNPNDTTTTSTTISETVTTTTPNGSMETASPSTMPADAPAANGANGASATDAPMDQPPATQDAPAASQGGDMSSDASTQPGARQVMQGKKTLAENSMSSDMPASEMNKPVEPPTNGKDLESSVNDQAEPTTDNAKQEVKANMQNESGNTQN